MKIKHEFLPLILGFFLLSCEEVIDKSEIKKNSHIRSISSFYPKERADVLVVGTFHFDYPNLDANKIAEEDKIDVLSTFRKRELLELITYIKKFKPTKIAIEAKESWNAPLKLKEFNKGKHHNERDERFQLGIRIASELKLSTIYSIDAKSFDKDLMLIDSVYFNTFFEGYDFESNDPMDKMTENWYNYDDTLMAKLSLLDYLKHINSQEYHRYDFGSYLVGDFKLDDYRGADILSIYWYNRNLRIFRNIQKISKNKKDKVLVIIGNGHASVLRQLIESSPEFNFIEFSSL
jgi:hypothetical protein